MRHLVLLATLLALATPLCAQETVKPEIVHLWPNGQPGFENRKDIPEEAAEWWVHSVNNPSLTVFRPEPGKASGAAVIVVPGGGHLNLVFNAEGVEPAQYLQNLGVTTFALKYVLARQEGSPYSIEGDAGADMRRAIRYVRAHAAEYGIDPDRIGIMGFSAGGELTSLAAFDPKPGDPAATDPVERASSRPDFLIEVYPGPLFIPPVVDKAPPPVFLINAYDDRMAMLDTDVIQHMYALFPEVPFERHVLSGGGHGFNMGQRSKLVAVNTWPARLADWLKDQGYLAKK